LVKCLVWDLDNTLWQGTLLEDERVTLTDAVRDVVAELDARGILQAISSKNDHDLAWARLAEFGIADYFVVPRIGWGPKSASVREIADELKFALGTIAFIDDQPAERAEVSYHLQDVRCYAAEQVVQLPGLAEFSPPVVTADARQRRVMYQAGFRREQERAGFTGPDEDFLRSLELVMTIAPATVDGLARVEELTLRTSQMNATGVHYPAETLRRLIDDARREVLMVTLTDRFGPHGAVGIVLLEKHPQVWHLGLLATSCRVVSFGAGTVILRWLTDQAARCGVHLVADFRRTGRNRMMEIAYRFAGFTGEDVPAGSGCGCRCVFPAAPGVERFHLAPARQEPPTTMRLVAADLAPVESRRGVVQEMSPAMGAQAFRRAVRRPFPGLPP
jgi:methoxymalonate biosynthesis protein